MVFDDDSDDILYIDETARPSQPWYTIVRKIAPRLLVEPYRTAEEHDDVIADGWKELERTLLDDSDGLSLPDGAESAIDVIPATLRHKLKTAKLLFRTRWIVRGRRQYPDGQGGALHR